MKELKVKMPTSAINTAFMQLSLRAESVDSTKLMETFVNVGPLMTMLSTTNDQIVYGRRGTGKTHAFKFLAQTKRRNHDIVAEIDLRMIGSSSGYYADQNVPIAQRVTRLLSDTLIAFHEALRKQFIDDPERFDLSKTGPVLDELADAATQVEVQVVGTVESESTRTVDNDSSHTFKSGFDLTGGKPGLKLEGADENKNKKSEVRRIKEAGSQRLSVRYGAVGRNLKKLTSLLGSNAIWLLLDEWSSVPIELQPYLADCLRRCILPVSGITLKIAAIEQRSNFNLRIDPQSYTGFEVGADISADISLDDFMVFNNKSTEAQIFFKELLFKHFTESSDTSLATTPKNSDELIREAFTQSPVFDDLVRAAEGVPRDAINIITIAAQKANDRIIARSDMNDAAMKWYQRDKEANVRTNAEAHELLEWIISEVVGTRRARAFLLRNDTNDRLIDELFDFRVLHVIKRNISTKEEPGVRYNVYQMDYGCYIDLKETKIRTLGQLPAINELGEEVFEDVSDVPSDNYRDIRRAILNLSAFKNRYRDRPLSFDF